jgi:4'-phosphopantetheinyl transferase EntD
MNTVNATTVNATDRALARAIVALGVPGVQIRHRLIAEGDEQMLLPEEIAPFAASVVKVRRASGAARFAARELMPHFGCAPTAIPKSVAGPPIWPDGIVGSLAHDNEVAVAAVAAESDFLGVGIDIEPAEPLDGDLLGIVATPRERRDAGDDPIRGRLLFAIKEAVYKAVNPLDGVFLDHHDVEVSLADGTAVVRQERVVQFRYCVANHIIVLAFIPAVSAQPALI